MGYIIQYDPEKNAQYPSKAVRHGRKGRYFVIAIFLCMIFVLAIRYRSAVQDWLIPGDTAVTTAAFETFSDEVRNGKPLGEAIAAFCKEVIVHETE